MCIQTKKNGTVRARVISVSILCFRSFPIESLCVCQQITVDNQPLTKKKAKQKPEETKEMIYIRILSGIVPVVTGSVLQVTNP